MWFWTLLEVASMPILQVLLISILGVLLATDYLNLLPPDTRKNFNKSATGGDYGVRPFAVVFMSMWKGRVSTSDPLHQLSNKL